MQPMRCVYKVRALVTGPYWRAALCLLLAGFSALTYAQPHVSIAVHTGKPDLVFSSGEQINRVQAAQAALANCRNTLASSPESESTGVCELARMDDIVVTPATDILPNAPSPLILWRFQH